MTAPVSAMSVVVVSFNTREVLRKCLRSVVAASASQIIVVDDGSTDGSIEMVRRDFPCVMVLQNPSNVGYGASANAGMTACASDYCLLLNADTVIPPDALIQLAAYLDAHPTAGVVGPRLVNPDGSLQRSIHQFPSTLVTLLDYSWLGRWLGKIPLLRKAYVASDSHERPRVVDWVTGAALAFRQPAYTAVGGFDRRFFMYYEEVDLSYRLHQAGWETHFTPVVDVVHIGGASTSPQRHAMYMQQLASGIQFFEQHYSPSAARRGRWAFATAMRVNWLGDLVRSRLDFDRESAAAACRRLPEWRAVLRGLREPRRDARVTGTDPRPQFAHDATRAAIGSAWRFLMPGLDRDGFGRVAVYGGPAGYASALVEAGVARAVAEQPVRASADLVLAFADATARADEIIAAVSPGGVLYFELDRDRRGRPTTRPRAVRALLAQAGLEYVSAYSVEPNFAAPESFIGVSTPQPHAWFLRARFSATSWAQWAGARVRQMLLAVTGVPIGFRRLALVAVSAGRVAAQPLAWRACHAAFTLPPDGRDLVLLHSGDERVVLLPFARGSAQPRSVVKVPTRPEHNHRTTTEHAVLGAITAALSSALTAAVPKPLALMPLDDVMVAVESTVPGRLVSSSARAVGVSTAHKTADFVALMEWLIAFHHSTSRDRPFWDEAAQVRWLEQPFEELAATCHPTTAERELLHRASARGRTLIGRPLPTVWQHRDFNIWNLVVERGRPGVLDWEGAQPGLPLCDAFQLAISWVQAMEFPGERSAEAGALTQIVTRSTGASAAVLAARRALRHYVDTLRIDRAFVAPLLVAHRVELIHRRRQQLQRAGASAISKAEVVEYPAFASLAEQTETLFAAAWPEWR